MTEVTLLEPQPGGGTSQKKVSGNEKGIYDVQPGKSVLLNHDMILPIKVPRRFWFGSKLRKIAIHHGKGEGLNLRHPESGTAFTMEMTNDLDHDRSLKQLKDDLKEEQGIKLETVLGMIQTVALVVAILILLYVAFTVPGKLDEIYNYLVYIKPPPAPAPA